MPATDSDAWIGRTLIDSDDRWLGTIEETYHNKETGQPLWMVVKTGRLRTKRRFVPLAGAVVAGDAIRTPRAKTEIDAAPDVDLTDQLADDAVRNLYRHYEMALEPSVASAPAQPDPERERVVERILRYVD